MLIRQYMYYEMVGDLLELPPSNFNVLPESWPIPYWVIRHRHNILGGVYIISLVVNNRV